MNTWMSSQEFGKDKLAAILEYLNRFYGPPSLQELNHAFLLLQNRMDHNQPVEVMLCNTE